MNDPLWTCSGILDSAGRPLTPRVLMSDRLNDSPPPPGARATPGRAEPSINASLAKLLRQLGEQLGLDSDQHTPEAVTAGVATLQRDSRRNALALDCIHQTLTELAQEVEHLGILVRTCNEQWPDHWPLPDEDEGNPSPAMSSGQTHLQ